MRQILPGDGIGVTITRQRFVSLQEDYFFYSLSKNQRSLHCQVHNHDALGTQAIGKDLERIGDQETRPGDGVEDGEKPYKNDLWITRRFDVLGLLIDRRRDRPG